MGAAVSSSHFVSATPSSPGRGLLTIFPCSSLGSLPWETVLHEVFQQESFPWAAVLHELPLCGSLPMGCSPSGTGCCSLPTNLLWHGLLFTGPQALPGACSSVGFPWGHSLLWMHPSALVWGLSRAAGGYLIHHGRPWSAGGQPPSPWSSSLAAGNLCSGAYSTSSLFFFTDLAVCRVVSLRYSHSSLLLHLFFPLL